MKNKMILFVLGLSLASCTSQVLPTGGHTQETIVSACQSYKTALGDMVMLADQKKLTNTDILATNKIRAVANPVCTNPTQYSTPNGLMILENAITQLNTIGANP